MVVAVGHPQRRRIDIAQRETRRASNSTRRIISAAGLAAVMTVDSPAGPSR
jgi:hypothetical protein